PRFCVDFRGTINKHLIRNSWPLPSMDECLSTLGSSKYLSLQHWIWVPVWTRLYPLRYFDSFIALDGKYEFQRLPFGVQNAPWIFQRFMSETFSSIGLSSGLLVYLDDIVLASPSWTHHKQLITTVLSMLQDVGITLKPSKAQFGLKQIHYLGHDVSPQGIAVSQARVEAILECILLKLEDHKDISSRWNRPQQRTAFNECKRILSGAPVLHFPDFSKEFFIHVDASNVGAGASLAHKNDDDNFDIIAYHSALRSPSQRKYSATQKECLAGILAIQPWRPYVWGKHFTVISDHSALWWLHTMQDRTKLLTRWALACQGLILPSFIILAETITSQICCH
ncbi:unnamed protein product, partial [Choristocarpus tenellus]